MKKLLIVLLVAATFASCRKEEAQTSQPEDNGTVYVRIQVIDEDGSVTYTTVSAVK